MSWADLWSPDAEFTNYVSTSLLAMIDEILDQAVLHAEASKVADPAAANLKTVEDALARGQVDKANKTWYVVLIKRNFNNVKQ